MKYSHQILGRALAHLAIRHLLARDFTSCGVLTALCLLSLHLLPAQVPYAEPRYGWRVEPGITYGQAVDYGGFARELRMDLYKPSCDFNPARPLFVIVHGGAFLGGSERDGDVVALCRQLAQRGAVAASISYRLGFHLKGGNFDPGFFCNADLKCLQALDSAEVVRALYRGMQDAKGAIRFLKARHALDSTDVENVFIGGSSAGGFIALYTGFLDPEEKPAACFALPDAPPPSPLFPNNCSVAAVSRARPDLGSIEGELHLGNGYDASVHGVANFMGGMLENILPGERKPALYLYHQTDDLVAGCHYARPFSLLNQHCGLLFTGCTPLYNTWPLVQGSCRIIELAAALGAEAPLVIPDLIDNGPPGVLSCLTGNNHSIVGLEQRVRNMLDGFRPLILASGNTGAVACPPQFATDCSGSVAQTAFYGDAEAAYNRAHSLLALPDGTFLAAGEWEGAAAVFQLDEAGGLLGYETYSAAIGGTVSALSGLAHLADGSIIALGQCTGCGPEDEQERSIVLKLEAGLALQQFRLLGKPASCDNCTHLNRNPVLLADAERIIVASEVGVDNPLNFSDLNFSVLTHELEVEYSTRLHFRGFDQPFAVLPYEGNYLVLANHPVSESGVSFALFNRFGSALNTTQPLAGVVGYAALWSDNQIVVAGQAIAGVTERHPWIGRFSLPGRQLLDEIRLEEPFNGQGVALALLGPCRALLGTWQAQPNDLGTYRASRVYRLSWCDSLRLAGPPDALPNPNELTSMTLQSLTALDNSGYRYLAAGWRGFNQSRSFVHSRRVVPLSGALEATAPACAGDADGAIAVLAQGVPPLSYAWAGSAATSASLGGLAAGAYTVTVTDGACQSLTLEVDLPDGPALDLAVNLLGDTLTAAETDADYQWIDCGTGLLIAGAVQQSFAPSQSGSYAVRLSRGGCQQITGCIEVVIVGLKDAGAGIRHAHVFPNPNAGRFTLELPWPAAAALHDAMGRLLWQQPFAAGQHELTLDAPAGVYLLVLRHGGGGQVVRVVRR
jgi:dienelactone hydrolase